MRTLLAVTITLLIFLSACSVPQTPAPPTDAPIIAQPQTSALTAVPEATPAAPKPISDEASAYLEEAIKILQENGINRKTVDWAAVREKAFQMADGAQSPNETYPAIYYMMQEAGGKHSNFNPPASVEQIQQASANDSPSARGKLLLSKIGYIEIEYFRSVNIEEGVKYADALRQIIRDLDNQGACGWIVDLRQNAGGNMWPMLAGIGPLLGSGKAGSFIDPDGNEITWAYEDGKALIGGEVSMQVSGEAYHLKNETPPVAVFTGSLTGSSGEAIAVSFIGRPQTRSFGQYTAGYSTSNQIFELSDGAWMILTTAIFADRTGRTYGGPIQPDQIIEETYEYITIDNELIFQPAVDWLMAQPACGGTGLPRESTLISRENLPLLMMQTFGVPEDVERFIWPGPRITLPGSPAPRPDLLLQSGSNLHPIKLDPISLDEPMWMPLDGTEIAAVAPDGSSLVIQSFGRAAAYGLDGTLIRKLPIPVALNGANYSYDGQFLVVTSADRWEASIYDLSAGAGKKPATLTGFETNLPEYGVKITPDGKTIAWYAGANLQLQNVATRKMGLTFSFEGLINDFAFSPDGSRLALHVADTIYLFQLPDGTQLGKIPLASPLHSLGWSPDGNLLAAGQGRSLSIWDGHTLEPLISLPGPNSFTGLVAFSPDGHYIVTTHEGKQISVWKIK